MSALDDARMLIEADPLHLVFIAGPYFGDGTEATIEGNIQEAEAYAIALANAGIGFFCPHLHTRHFGLKATAGEPFYHRLDFQQLIRCDAVLFTPRWRSSSGARREHAWAQWRNMPIFFPQSPQDIEEIVDWNRQAGHQSPLELEVVAREAAYRFGDFDVLPGWSPRDQEVVDKLLVVTYGRTVPDWHPESAQSAK